MKSINTDMRLATGKEKFNLLGPPGDETDLIRIMVPPMKIAWMKDYTIKSFTCNKVIAVPLQKVYNEIITTISPEEVNDSGILIFGGCYNFRPTRPSENSSRPIWSAHAWAVAVDHDPKKNGLYWKKSRANFPKHPKIIEIFNKYGFLNFGQAPDRNGKPYDRDWMHFEASLQLLENPVKFINP